MKKNTWSLAGAMFLGGALLVSGCASQNNAGRDHLDDNATRLTRSYVPQPVEHNGTVVNGKSCVRVIERSDLWM